MKSKSLLPYLAIPLLLASNANAAFSSVAASGWNYDVVLNNPSPYNLSVTGTMDNGPGNVENWTWVEAGNYTNSSGDVVFFNGLTAGSHTSIGPSGAEFTFQDFSSENAVLLSSTQSQVLTLDTAAAYSSLAFIGAASNGGSAEVSVVLTFSDLTTATFSTPDGIARDWFDSASPESAYLVGGRAANRSEDGYSTLFIGTSDAIRLHEWVITLDAADQGKELVSIDVSNPGSGGTVALFAVSGEAIPEPSVALLSGAALLGLGLRRRRI